MHVLTILVFYSANIYVSLILPVGDNRWPGCTTNPDDDEWFNYQIQLLNQLLEEMCHSNNIYVINHPRFYRRGKIQRQLLARDGLHLNERGTKQLASDILTKLNPVTKQQKHFPKSTKPTWTEVLADLTDDYPQLPTTTVAVDVNQLNWPTQTSYASKLKPMSISDADFPPLTTVPKIPKLAFKPSYSEIINFSGKCFKKLERW